MLSMIGNTDDCRAGTLAVSLGACRALLLGILLPLATTACGTLTAPDMPANLRYWHDVDEFVVLHWDASPGAEYYKVYYGDCSEEHPCWLLGESRSTTAAGFIYENLYRCKKVDFSNRTSVSLL